MKHPRVNVTVTRATHGPVQQIQLTLSNPDVPRALSFSAFRVGGTLIDAGPVTAVHKLVEVLADDPPRRVVLTHQHEDHVGGAAALRRAFGHFPVYAPRDHVAIIAESHEIPWYRAVTWGQPEPIEDAIPFDAGEVFEEGTARLEALPTPGHTPGHMAWVARTARRSPAYAMTGDLYLASRTVLAWHESAAEDRAASCRRVADCEEAVWLMRTHGRAREDGAQALRALAEWLDREIEAIRELAERLGTRDYRTLADARYPAEDPLESLSKGEFSRICFVRSILDPVRTLPADVPL